MYYKEKIYCLPGAFIFPVVCASQATMQTADDEKAMCSLNLFALTLT